MRRWPFLTLAALLSAAPPRPLEPPQPVNWNATPVAGSGGPGVEAARAGCPVRGALSEETKP